GAATDISCASAILNGTIKPAPEGSHPAPKYHFRYSRDMMFISYDVTSDTQAGSSNVAVSAPIFGLTPSTVYYFALGLSFLDIPFHAALNPPSFHIGALAMASAAPAAGTYGAVISTLDGNSLKGYAIYAGPTGKWELWLGDGVTPLVPPAAITSTADVLPGQI